MRTTCMYVRMWCRHSACSRPLHFPKPDTGSFPSFVQRSPGRIDEEEARQKGDVPPEEQKLRHILGVVSQPSLRKREVCHKPQGAKNVLQHLYRNCDNHCNKYHKGDIIEARRATQRIPFIINCDSHQCRSVMIRQLAS